MIELTWAMIRNPQFLAGLSKLVNAGFEFKTAYHISRIFSRVDSEYKESQKFFMKFVEKYADIDQKTGSYKVKDEHLEKWKEETKNFDETKFVIEKSRVNIADLNGVNLTPLEILALEPILLGLEVLKGEKTDGKS